MPILTAHYSESQYKTYLYGDFLNLYSGGSRGSILATGNNVANRHLKYGP
jgi:hypothetical protein